jgi:hemolysin activation/secretion protein
VIVEGNTLIDSAAIQSALAPLLPYQGEAGNLTSLSKLTDTVTGLYHAKGYFLAQAYLPEQEIAGGVLKIAVLEGALGKVSVTGNRAYPESFIRGHFPKMEGEKQIHHQTFERPLLILNEYMDLTATGLFEASKTAGRSDLTLRVEEQRPLHYTLDYNNFGSKLVSRHRFGTGLEVGNWFKPGSVFSVRGVVGSPVGNAVYGRVGYGAPVNFNGTRVNFTLGAGDFNVERQLAALKITMETMGWSLSATHPFIKTRSFTLLGETGLDFQDFEQNIGGLPGASKEKRSDRIRKVRGQMDYNRQRGQGRDIATVSIHQGLKNTLGGMRNNDAKSSRSGADNGFTKVVLEAARFQGVTEMLSVVVRGTGQSSTDDLVAGEQLSLGGPDSVRGYAAGEFLGDSGYSLNIEMRVMPLTDKGLLQAAFFIDQGEGYLKNGAKSQPSSGSLSGAGFGIRSHFPYPYANAKAKKLFDADIRAEVGYPLQDGPFTKVDAAYYLQASLRF